MGSIAVATGSSGWAIPRPRSPRSSIGSWPRRISVGRAPCTPASEGPSMFRISHVIGTHREHDRRCLSAIQDLLATDFPDLAADDEYVARKLVDQTARGTPCILLVAHGPGDRV